MYSAATGRETHRRSASMLWRVAPLAHCSFALSDFSQTHYAISVSVTSGGKPPRSQSITADGPRDNGRMVPTTWSQAASPRRLHRWPLVGGAIDRRADLDEFERAL